MDFIRQHAIQLLGLVFAAGISFSELRALHTDIDTIEQRLEKKSKLIKELDKRINNLEKCSH